jgi:hypothetical protein
MPEDVSALARFVGTWQIRFEMPGLPAGDGTTTFDWMMGQRYLVQHATAEHPDAPDGHMIIAPDQRRGTGYLQHYFDSRGVARVYKMSLEGGVWMLWRDAPDFSPLDFSQRYTGTFTDDGRSIAGAWEINHGEAWEHDFGLTYTKTG